MVMENRRFGSRKSVSNWALVISTFPETSCSNPDCPSGGSGGRKGVGALSVGRAGISRVMSAPWGVGVIEGNWGKGENGAGDCRYGEGAAGVV
jgi:hypothetical protein